MVKYINIHRMKKNYVNGFSLEDTIVIQEKVDGSNFSIRVEDGEVSTYSISERLCPNNTLRGAYNWVQSQNLQKIKGILGEDFILYGEWVTPHAVKYPVNNVAYFYDVWSISRQCYLDWEVSKVLVEKLGFTFVPVFYCGNFQSWEHIYSFIGKSELGATIGEGIVVKNMSHRLDVNGRFPYYVKLVSNEFAEVKKTDEMDFSGINARVRNQKLVDTIITEQRIDKLLRKMVDTGDISEGYSEADKAKALKLIGTAVYRDCTKEEPEIVEQVGKTFMSYAITTAKKLVNNSSLFK